MAFSDEEKFLKAFALRSGIDVTAPENKWVSGLYTVAKRYIDENMVPENNPDALYDYILSDTESPELAPFRARFSAYLDERTKSAAAGGKPVWDNVGEYLTTESDYIRTIKSKPGFADIATIENVKKFIAGGNSVDEIGRRIDEAFYTVQTADAALKEQLKTDFPTLNESDIARALVTGSTNEVEQKIKIGSAQIRAEQKIAGVAGKFDTNELVRQGVTRDVAKKGFQQMAAEAAGIQQAARTFGAKAPTQEELAQEAFGIKTSAGAKALRSQARSQFAGQSGIVTGSLSRKKQV